MEENQKYSFRPTFLGVDAPFKLKLEDCEFKDPGLGTGLACMVEDSPYQKYLGENVGATAGVTFIKVKSGCYPDG